MTNSTQKPLPESIVGWIRKHAIKNYWRVASQYELEDLIQDGLTVGYKCQARYPDVEPKHLMSLIKTAFYRHITEFLRTKIADDYYLVKFMDLPSKEPVQSEHDVMERMSQAFDMPLAEFAVFISELPKWVQKVLEFYSTSEGIAKLHRTRTRLSSSDETITERFRRLTGMPDNVEDWEAEVQAYLS